MKEDIMLCVERFIDDRVCPGVVLNVREHGRTILEVVHGTTQYDDPESVPITRDHLWDIASLTKVISATGLLLLVDRGVVQMEDTLNYFFPKLPYGDQVSLWHLLTQSSAIGVQMSKIAGGSFGMGELPPEVIQASLLQTPGSRVMWTNVNSYLIGKVIELVVAQSLDLFLHGELFEPLDMVHTCFNPGANMHHQIVPTEITDERGLVHGQVHDESTYRLGGIAGQAGLFSTVDDLQRFCDMWQEEKLLSPALVHDAVTCQIGRGLDQVGLGWVLNREWMGDFRGRAIAHTSFPGSSVIIDRRSGISVVVMRNRLYPTRSSGSNPEPYQQNLNNLLFQYFVSSNI